MAMINKICLKSAIEGRQDITINLDTDGVALGDVWFCIHREDWPKVKEAIDFLFKEAEHGK